MKRTRVLMILLTVILIIGLLLPSCGFEGDPMLDDLWTRNIYPGTTNTYDIGSLTYQYNNGYFQSLFVGGKAYFGANDDMTIWYDGTDGNIKTSDVGASDLNIITGAAKTLELNTAVWNDLFMPTSGAKIPAANTPTWEAFTANTKAYTFALNDYADLTSIEILHDYKEGTDIYLHLHIVTNGSDVNERKVKYTLYYTWGDTDEVMSAEGTATQELTIPAGTADMTHLFLGMGGVTGTNYLIESLFICRVERVGGTGTEPTNDPFVMMVGIHYAIDTIGSRSELAK